MKLKGKNIFITGGNRGIGKAFAEEAARRGMIVHIVCRSQPEGLDKELKDLGAQDVRIWPVDMSNRTSIDQLVSSIKQSKIPVEVLINNAGQLTGGLLEEQPLDRIYQMLQVNLTGLIHLTHSLLPDMLKLPTARIVNNASVSGKMFIPCASTYAASKAGVVAFTECLKQELRSTSVSTLLLITPGVKSRMYDEISDLYGGHLELDALGSIPSTEWAKRVFDAIENNQDICWPTGASRIGVWIGHHLPGLLEKFVKPKFKR